MEIPRHWRLKAQRYRLEGSICPACGRASFPPSRVCPSCAAQPASAASLEIFAAPLTKHPANSVLSKG